MPNTSIIYTVPISTIVDLSKNQITEKIFNKETPVYAFVYPETRNHPSTSTRVHPLQLQSKDNMNCASPVICSRPIGEIECNKCWSVLNMICCFIGCLAFYYSYRAGDMQQSGNIQGALKASSKASTINAIATLIGISTICISLSYAIYYGFSKEPWTIPTKQPQFR
jgi:hypothetical protein